MDQRTGEDVIPLARGPRSAVLSGLGMAVFLGSWAVSFVTLFVLDLSLRWWNPLGWPPPELPDVTALVPGWVPAACTVEAILSSLVAHRVLSLVRQGRARRAVLPAGVAITIGLAFLVCQLVAWQHVAATGYASGRHVYYGVFLLLTGFHAAHVLVSAVLLCVLVPGLARATYGARNTLPVQHVTWFWHFTTAAWLGTCGLVYVW